MRNRTLGAMAALALVSAVQWQSQAQAQPPEEQINVICSVQVEWCNLIQTTFARVARVKVNMVQRSTGEALAQINAERANPKTDLWFGGTGDPHLAAAAQGLTDEYKSPALPQLHPWAQRQAEQSGWRTVGIYLGPLGLAYNTEMLAKRKLQPPKSWADLLKPEFKGEVQMANPASSGGAYTAVATLIQVMGEDKAWDYMARLHKNITTYPRSGEAPIKAVSRGEATVAIVFMALQPGEKAQGFPVEAVAPSEGTGAEIGAMSLIKGAPHPKLARQLYEWALTPQAQQFAFAARGFQVPSNKATPLDPRVPDVRTLKLIDYDYARFGKPAERQRVIQAWESKVRALPQ